MGCQTPLKIHFHHSIVTFLPPNLRAVYDEHRKRINLSITKMELEALPRQRNPSIMGGYVLLDPMCVIPECN